MGIMMTTALTTHILHNFTPLNVLSENRLKDVLTGCYVESVKPDTVLFSYGDCDDKTIFLLSGELELIDYQGKVTLLNALDYAANYAISPSKPRQFTVKVKKPSNILAVDQQKLNDALLWEQSLSSLAKTLFAQLPENIDRDWLLLLLQSRIFYRLPPMNILEILASLEEVSVLEGQKIIAIGEEADSCYFIKKGKVQVCQNIDDEYLTVAYLGRGDFFGEEGLLKDSPRNADVIMLEDCVLMRLVKKDFDRLLKKPTLQAFSFELANNQVQNQEAAWLDVRLAEEFSLQHLTHALHLPLPDIRLKSRQLPLNQHYIICCDNGQRSAAAAFLLGIQGYNVSVLSMGLEGLSAQQRQQYMVQ